MNTTNEICLILNTVKNFAFKDGTTFWTMIQAVGVVTTLGLIGWQIKQQRMGNNITSLIEIETNWKSDEMVRSRQEICQIFLDSKEVGIQSGGGVQSTWRIGRFMETLGLYHERKMVDSVIIWNLYSFGVENYWSILKPTIEAMRKADNNPKLYENFEKFFYKMRTISKKQGAVIDIISREMLLKFAKDELDRHDFPGRQ